MGPAAITEPRERTTRHQRGDGTTMATMAATSATSQGMTREERFVILASSIGTVFEWYDFYLYATLAPFFAALFFPPGNETAALLSAFATYAAGFLVRPFGAIIFGRVGDLVGRKYTFLVTILVMGISTFAVGLLPTYGTQTLPGIGEVAGIGILAPVLLIGLRLLQGLALGGEYGGAATYVAEHAPAGRRGFYTSFIQITATAGLFLSLLVILGVRTTVGEEAFAAWGWRVPFLISAVLVVISIWIRLQLAESPAWERMRRAGTRSKAPIKEAFGTWRNARMALIALLGLTAGQAVVWYSGQFCALFFLGSVLKVDGYTANLLVAWALLLGAWGFVAFGWLSDKIGRKPIILGGCLLAALTYFPVFYGLSAVANPALTAAHDTVPVVVRADPAECSFQFNPVGTAKFTTGCDTAKAALARGSVRYTTEDAAPGEPTTVRIGPSLPLPASTPGFASVLTETLKIHG